MITGIARNVIAKEIAMESNTSNISLILVVEIYVRAANPAGWLSFKKPCANYSLFLE
jgi:hypothetical protein